MFGSQVIPDKSQFALPKTSESYSSHYLDSTYGQNRHVCVSTPSIQIPKRCSLKQQGVIKFSKLSKVVHLKMQILHGASVRL